MDRLDFISPVHKTSLWRSSMRAGITRIPLHVSRSRGCVPVDSTARSGLFKAYISKLRFFVDGEFVVRMEFVQTKDLRIFTSYMEFWGQGCGCGLGWLEV